MADYDEREVERLLPTLWNEALRLDGMAEPVRHTTPEQAKGVAEALGLSKSERRKRMDATPPEARQSYKNPKHSGGHMAACADMQRAWELADLTLRERQILLMRYGLRWDLDDCADYYGNAPQSCWESEKNGVRKMAEFLTTGQSKTLTARRAALAAKTERKA